MEVLTESLGREKSKAVRSPRPCGDCLQAALLLMCACLLDGGKMETAAGR